MPRSRWERLDDETRTNAATPTRDPTRLRTEVIKVLKRLAARRQCAGTVVGWITTGRTITFSASADTRDTMGHPALRLVALPRLIDGAVLSLSITLDGRGALTGYSAGVTGVRPDGIGWYARVDMGTEPEGEGPCGHSLLHCHVGVHPDESVQARVPLPWLEPTEALEWLLATLDPRHEPRSSG